jgi:flagellar hook-associated protein 3 FlgL
MAINPINLGRVSQNLKAFTLLNTMRSNQLGLYNVQNQIATGLRFQRPSQEPLAAGAAGRLDRKLESLAQVQKNLRDANAFLAEGESAMQDAINLAIEANTLAIEAASDGLTPDERSSLAVVIDSILEQLVSIGNREHLGTPLFSGHYGDSAPFEQLADGVLFRGDAGRLKTILDTNLAQDTFSISGLEFFQTESAAVVGFADLDPRLTLDTRIADLDGALGQGVGLGRIAVSDGATTVDIDLTGVDTIGDLLDRLNAGMPDTLVAIADADAIRIQSAGAAPVRVTITDTAGGTTAVDLGIFTNQPLAAIAGLDLNARLTERTRISDFYLGAGVDLTNGFTITNGAETARLDFAGAATLEDLLNRINQTDIGVTARIAADGSRIEIRNRVSGRALRISENGGLVATALGVRSLHAGVPLSALRQGLGVDSVVGDDFRVTTEDGTTIDVDINDLDLGSATVQDVLNLLNTRGGGAITATLSQAGAGIVIADNTDGAGALRIERLNVSPTIDSLGLNVAATGGQLVGGDVNPIVVDGPFTALLELRTAMRADDAKAVTAAGQRLQRTLSEMQRVQGELAARARVMLERETRVEAETVGTRLLLSEARDTDLTEAVVRFQQAQTALQANLAVSSTVFDLSLLDYLR